MSAHASQAFSIAHCTDSEDLPGVCLKTADHAMQCNDDHRRRREPLCQHELNKQLRTADHRSTDHHKSPQIKHRKRQIFRIGTVRYAEGLWRIYRFGRLSRPRLRNTENLYYRSADFNLLLLIFPKDYSGALFTQTLYWFTWFIKLINSYVSNFALSLNDYWTSCNCKPHQHPRPETI